MLVFGDTEIPYTAVSFLEKEMYVYKNGDKKIYKYTPGKDIYFHNQIKVQNGKLLGSYDGKTSEYRKRKYRENKLRKGL